MAGAGRAGDNGGGSRRVELSPGEREGLRAAVARACAAEPSVVVAYLHGSAARGEPAADIDVALLLDEPLEAPSAFRLCERLAARVEGDRHPPLPLDVRPINGTGPVFRFHVLLSGTLAYCRSESERVAAESSWMSEWHDFRPFWERQVAVVMGRRATAG